MTGISKRSVTPGSYVATADVTSQILGHWPEDHPWTWGSRVGPLALAWSGLIGTVFILSALILAPKGIVAKMFSGPILLRAGDISFSIYSLHPWVDMFTKRYILTDSTQGLDRLAVIMAAVWTFSELTYAFVEMPFMRLGNALCQKVDGLVRCLEEALLNQYRPISLIEQEERKPLEEDIELFESEDEGTSHH
jgi:hypothetical protein